MLLIGVKANGLIVGCNLCTSKVIQECGRTKMIFRLFRHIEFDVSHQTKYLEATYFWSIPIRLHDVKCPSAIMFINTSCDTWNIHTRDQIKYFCVYRATRQHKEGLKVLKRGKLWKNLCRKLIDFIFIRYFNYYYFLLWIVILHSMQLRFIDIALVNKYLNPSTRNRFDLINLLLIR